VSVTVATLPAVCHNLNCDFTYIANVGEITSFTYTDATKVLTIQGKDFPAALADY